MAANFQLIETAHVGSETLRMAFGVHRPSRIAHLDRTMKTVRRFWYTKRVTLGNQRRFSLVELMLATAIIGILSAIVVPLYAKKHIITWAAPQKVTAQQPPPPGGEP